MSQTCRAAMLAIRHAASGGRVVVWRHHPRLPFLASTMAQVSSDAQFIAVCSSTKSCEALVGFQGRGRAEGVQPNCCHPVFLEALLFPWPSIRRCASRTMGELKTPESKKSVSFLAIGSPIPEAPPVTAATLPLSCPIDASLSSTWLQLWCGPWRCWCCAGTRLYWRV
jgi:hypothetical protein